MRPGRRLAALGLVACGCTLVDPIDWSRVDKGDKDSGRDDGTATGDTDGGWDSGWGGHTGEPDTRPTGVWIYQTTTVPDVDPAGLEAALVALGATVTISTSATWPVDWSGVRLVVLLLPDSPFDTVQVAALRDHLAAGGRLVVAADHEGFSGQAATIDDLMEQLDVALTVVPESLEETPCGQATVHTTAALTDGVEALYLAASSVISGGEALAWFRGYPILASDQPSGAAAGQRAVVLAGDVNLFVDYCEGMDAPGFNRTLWENLYRD